MKEFESLPDFQALLVAARGRPERRMGDSVIPAEPPQWSEVRKLAKNLAKSHSDQLTLHIHIIQAEASINGFVGFYQALQSASELLQNQWDSMSPAPDLDDPDDMYYARVNLLRELSEQPVFLDILYRLTLISMRGIGEFSTRDIDIALGAISGSDEDSARCQEGLIRGAVAESDPDDLQQRADAMLGILQLCRSIEEIFSEKTGQAGVLSLDRLYKRVGSCRDRFMEFAQERLNSAANLVELEDSTDVEMKPVGDSASEQAALPVKESSLSDRSMVIASFDAILYYYQQQEPSSPVRVLTHRAKGFVDKSFFDVLQSLAPAFKDNLPSMLNELQKQPLASLLSDSYARHLGGEALPELQNGEYMQTPGNSQGGNVASGSADSGNSHIFRVIVSREEVQDALQDIESYFMAKEPASPMPLIIADIRKLVPKRFADLVVELSRLLPVSDAEPG